METTARLKPEDKQYIHLSLLHLGVLKWSKSASRLRNAIEYVIENDVIPEAPVGQIYGYLARKEGTSYGTIERSLRYIIDELWANDPINCSKLFYRSFDSLPCPCVSEFLSLYVSAFQRGVIKEWVDSYQERYWMPDKQKAKEAQSLLDDMAKLNMLVKNG